MPYKSIWLFAFVHHLDHVKISSESSSRSMHFCPKSSYLHALLSARLKYKQPSVKHDCKRGVTVKASIVFIWILSPSKELAKYRLPFITYTPKQSPAYGAARSADTTPWLKVKATLKYTKKTLRHLLARRVSGGS